MKKSTILILFLLFVAIITYSLKNNNLYKVLKIKDSANIFVDLNKNNQIDDNELIGIYGIKAISKTELEEKDYIYLSYFSKKWTKEKLINKYVKVKPKEQNKAKVFLLGKDYGLEVLKNGYAKADGTEYSKEFNDNLDKFKKEDYLIYNRKNNKYHQLNCELGLKSDGYELIKKSSLPKDAIPCKLCNKTVFNHIQNINYSSQNKIEKYKNFDNLKIYFLDFSNTKKPLNDCNTLACKSLLNEINNAKHSIDFAIYGIHNEPKLYNALINSYRKGVKIRWVTDYDSRNNYYNDTYKLMKDIQNYKTDKNTKNKNSYRNEIMHNKFFIFDNKKVWTGSANITNTDFSDFNANNAILIDSKIIASIYQKEFNQLYNGNFHNNKIKMGNNQNIQINKDTKMSVYFSPQDKILTNQILKLIDSAQSYIYIPVFYFTSKPLAQKLINAYKREVDVKIITDATNASGKYSVHKFLRHNGVQVKVENKAGKMHMKTIVIDDKYTILGSMNLTKSGENKNDENVLIIENPKIAKYIKSTFNYLWNSIPNKYLNQNPPAESIYSIGSCTDGIDNDFDKKIDAKDEFCQFR